MFWRFYTCFHQAGQVPPCWAVGLLPIPTPTAWNIPSTVGDVPLSRHRPQVNNMNFWIPVPNWGYFMDFHFIPYRVLGCRIIYIFKKPKQPPDSSVYSSNVFAMINMKSILCKILMSTRANLTTTTTQPQPQPNPLLNSPPTITTPLTSPVRIVPYVHLVGSHSQGDRANWRHCFVSPLNGWRFLERKMRQAETRKLRRLHSPLVKFSGLRSEMIRI